MTIRWGIAAGALVVGLTASASAQFLGKSEMAVTAPKMGLIWSPKPTKLPTYVAPNKPIWRLAEILAAHKGKAEWVQPIVRNADQEADYIAMAPGKATKPHFYADDRIVWVVQDGSMKVTIDGYPPFVATKGFMVNVPFRHVYTIETLGDKPSLRFEVRQAGAVPLYLASETPDPVPGLTYQKVSGSPGPNRETDSNPIYVDFWKQVVQAGATPSKFVWDDHFTANILRGKGAPVPPDSNFGHFHIRMTEFWFIMEGRIGYKIEGMPYFVADQGDIVTAVAGRWHRAGNDPSAPMSTRIPFNPRPPILHNFQPAD
jgi:mannose-6-phosphate isomerase-like protein (cupin superfamily)